MATPVQRERTPLEQAELTAFGRRLADLMARKGLSQSDLARAIWGSTEDARGRSPAKNRDRISHYVRGSQLPEPKTMRALADALGVPVSELHPASVPGATRPGSPEYSMTMVGGRPDLALLTVNKSLPVPTALKILGLIHEAEEQKKDS